MAKKTSSTSRAARPKVFFFPPGYLPKAQVHIPDRDSLRELREHLGISQRDLAKESGVSRSVIANYESGRTPINSFLSFVEGLKLFRVLEVKERARNAAGLRGLLSNMTVETTAAKFLRGLLWLAKEVTAKRLAEIDGKIEILQRERENLKREVTEIETEEKALSARKDKPS